MCNLSHSSHRQVASVIGYPHSGQNLAIKFLRALFYLHILNTAHLNANY
jgi:hypothetical protein